MPDKLYCSAVLGNFFKMFVQISASGDGEPLDALSNPGLASPRVPSLAHGQRYNFEKFNCLSFFLFKTE
jgi:hypothetical protein